MLIICAVHAQTLHKGPLSVACLKTQDPKPLTRSHQYCKSGDISRAYLAWPGLVLLAVHAQGIHAMPALERMPKDPVCTAIAALPG